MKQHVIYTVARGCQIHKGHCTQTPRAGDEELRKVQEELRTSTGGGSRTGAISRCYTTHESMARDVSRI